ncbi:hypothetical protein B0T26DRAFT_617434, partial [Lasiosphaeria miniovina]
WSEIQAKYWSSTKVFRAQEERTLQETHRRQTEHLNRKLLDLFSERAKILQRVEELDKQSRHTQDQVQDLDLDLQAKRAAQAESWARDDDDKRRWFKKYGPGGSAYQESEAQKNEHDVGAVVMQDSPGAQLVHENAANGAQVTSELTSPQSTPLSETYQSPIPDAPPPEQTADAVHAHRAAPPVQLGEPADQVAHIVRPVGPATPEDRSFVPVTVTDTSGVIIGQVRPITLDNHWVSHVRQLLIKRSVQIRPGRRFNAETLESIYEPSDNKGAKWLSCYIQAAGEIQEHPCQTCTKGAGPYSLCVLLGGDDFPRCGNCEWNRQGCHGAAARSLSKQHPGVSGEPPASGGLIWKQSADNSLVMNGFTAVNSMLASQAARNTSPVAKDNDGKDGSDSKPGGRKLLPTTRMAPSQVDTPAASSTPMTVTPEMEAREPSQDLPEINKSVLSLHHNGFVFTEPPIMRGVPLVKVSPDHPYWESDWTPLESFVEPQLQKWKEKYDHHHQTNSSQSSKFLANRQINRGNAILKFLKDGELHPYQIVGKEFINKTLVNYDVLFRMVQVLEELPKFNIDITPSQWLRQRLHEVLVEQGENFSLSKTIHDLYHDPKVIALRTKSGFGNIGRPSGYRMEKGAPDSGGPKRAVRTLKRKEPHETPQTTPTHGPSREQPLRPYPPELVRPAQQIQVQAIAPAPPAEIVRPAEPPRRMKRRRLSTVSAASSVTSDELEYAGYTSSDSFSADHVMQVDWRVYQVKHSLTSTNTLVTQYWHWVDKADGGNEDNMFEHQVLKDVLPNKVTWGVYKDPIDFHLRLAELTEITYAGSSQKVIIGTKEIKGVTWRGDMLAHFKRERTKRRFLIFMKRLGVKLVKTTRYLK